MSNEGGTATQSSSKGGEAEEKPVSKQAGLNRFIWNTRYPDARNVPNAIYRSGGVTGPLAPPGMYQVRLTIGDWSVTESFEIRKDPRVEASDDDLRAQFALLLQIRDKLSETNDAIIRLRALRDQVDGWKQRSKGSAGAAAIAESAKALKDGIATIEEELLQTRWKSSRDALTAPSKLNAKLATLMNVVSGSDAAPTEQSREVYESLTMQLDQHLERFDTVLNRDVPRFNTLVRDQDLPALTIPESV